MRRLEVSGAVRPTTHRGFIYIFNYLLIVLFLLLLLLFQSALQPLVGFRPAHLSLSILSREVLQSVVASGTSNPQLGVEPGI
jgi:hypothetical protein